ncbi:hypothetical protein Cyrtocomes_01069 [Candidatus Cyrtobacter comes]|uniref:Uncharacterized protein n=1 Tax=Candidatus Cyrtobacter comes TaxID=675776 RepID=A0ABU5L979_9RICK|nr:hypothetical protein [Candidatus Cyrtobacter comes]
MINILELGNADSLVMGTGFFQSEASGLIPSLPLTV